MKSWDYARLVIDYSKHGGYSRLEYFTREGPDMQFDERDSDKTRDRFASAIAELGDDSWELVGVIPLVAQSNFWGERLWFKRQNED